MSLRDRGTEAQGCSGDEIEDHLCCPISREPMVDAVMAEDGQTYSRKAIQGWFDTGSRVSPMLNVEIGTSLLANRTVRQMVDAFFPSADPDDTELAAQHFKYVYTSAWSVLGAAFAYLWQ